jgi:hypothetical protein
VTVLNYQSDIDLLAHKLPEINCFNADTLLKKYEQELLALSQQYSAFSFKNLSKDMQTKINSFAPEIKSFHTDIIYSLFYDIFISNHKYHRLNSFKNYDESQPLFSSYPDLFSIISKHGKLEYIPAKELQYKGLCIDDAEVKFIAFAYQKHLLEIPYVNVELIEYILKKYKCDFDLHVSPYHIHNIENTQSCYEHGVIRPIDTKFMNCFILQKGFTGGLYDFSYMNEDLKDNETYYKSFKICQTPLVGSQGLEVVVKNRNKDMSMMLEELVINKFENILTGYCVHLDILNAYNRDLTRMEVNHIDLAINIYETKDMEHRLHEKLSDGKKVTKASYRTHLLRLENIPFLDIIKIISLFMIPQCLVMDWINDQFPNYPKN